MISHWREYFREFLGVWALFTSGVTLGVFNRPMMRPEDLLIIIPIAALGCAPFAYVGAYISWRVKQQRTERSKMKATSRGDEDTGGGDEGGSHREGE